jgi:hypothetical protein
MCTVSFIPVKEKIFITSNRDEKSWRLPAQLPKEQCGSHCKMIFPKDGDAGGSWITLCSNGNAGVLLNGAFEKHGRKLFYAKSRGLVFLEIMDNDRPLKSFLKISLQGIEPFTLILWQKNNLYECRWDEDERKHCKALPAYRPYIWSSSTLYDAEVRKKRELWFAKWLNNHPIPDQESILRFHRFGGNGDSGNDLFMNRDGKVFTVSITALELSEDAGSMNYTDLLADETVEYETEFLQPSLII